MQPKRVRSGPFYDVPKNCDPSAQFAWPSLIIPGLPVTAGYEWKQPSLVLLPLVFHSNEVDDESLMSQNHKHFGSPCAKWCARQVYVFPTDES